jgi:hypothetical protein
MQMRVKFVFMTNKTRIITDSSFSKSNDVRIMRGFSPPACKETLRRAGAEGRNDQPHNRSMIRYEKKADG